MSDEVVEGGCIHFPDDPNAVCTICKKTDRPVVDAWEAVPVQAKYHGECVECTKTIYPGDAIVQSYDGWAHANCRARG